MLLHNMEYFYDVFTTFLGHESGCCMYRLSMEGPKALRFHCFEDELMSTGLKLH